MILSSQNIFGRQYNAEEDKVRFGIFAKKLTAITEQNAKFARGESDHGANVNEFSDYTAEEQAKAEAENKFRPSPAISH